MGSGFPYKMTNPKKVPVSQDGYWATRIYLEVHGTYSPIITVLKAVLKGLVGYKYSYHWLTSTMNLQVLAGLCRE